VIDRCILYLMVGALASVSHAVFAEEAADSVRAVHFKNSCGEDIRDQFDYGITMLHSFEYPETTRVFGELIGQEPSCAMAYWGAAMSVWHPLWAPPSVADLRRGAELLTAAHELDASPRERAYLEALGVFFSDQDPASHVDRVNGYALAMSKVYHNNFESDPESAIFYALALLAAADPRDKSYNNQFRSAGILNWVRESLPRHPGVLHYIIHSYDFPGLAHLALSAAEEYAKAAPNSAHAQHMPSHIFTRLGLWEQSLSSNHDSTRSAAEYTERANLPGHYDEGLHSMDYLMYAMLQTARDNEAAALLERLEDIDRTDTENFKAAYTYASSPARYVLERRAWEEAANLELVRENLAWQDFGFALSIHHFARGIGAARSGQLDRAREELATIKDIQTQMPAATLPYWREQVQVHIDAITAWVLVSEERTKEALASARSAADLEDAVDKHPVTPGEVLPARELLADMLLEVGDPSRALVEYEKVLDNAPKRLNALIGAFKAAELSGQPVLAATYRAAIQEQIRNGTGPRAASLRTH